MLEGKIGLQEQVMMALGYEAPRQGQEYVVVPMEGLSAELPQQVERQVSSGTNCHFSIIKVASHSQRRLR